MSHCKWSTCNIPLGEPHTNTPFDKPAFILALNQLPANIYISIFSVRHIQFDMSNISISLQNVIVLHFPIMKINNVPVQFIVHNHIIRSWETSYIGALLIKAVSTQIEPSFTPMQELYHMVRCTNKRCSSPFDTDDNNLEFIVGVDREQWPAIDHTSSTDIDMLQAFSKTNID